MLLNNYSILPKEDPPEGKTTAIIAVMWGKPKDSHHCHRSNKHYKQKLVQVLLDSGSDGNIIFVDKGKPMLLPSSKRLVPQLWNTLNGMFQTKRKAGIELNFFEYSNSKRYLLEPDIVKYNKNNKPQYDLILGVKTMKECSIILDLKEKIHNMLCASHRTSNTNIHDNQSHRLIMGAIFYVVLGCCVVVHKVHRYSHRYII
jgi:hypothetical protein